MWLFQKRILFLRRRDAVLWFLVSLPRPAALPVVTGGGLRLLLAVRQGGAEEWRGCLRWL